eukprot:scaffold2696_cov333-Pavlova_lutheri.AAC.4
MESNALTSLGSLLQFSDENANTVRAATPFLAQDSTACRSACAPARCPAAEGSPLVDAHLLFPSMMTATCCGTGAVVPVASFLRLVVGEATAAGTVAARILPFFFARALPDRFDLLGLVS